MSVNLSSNDSLPSISSFVNSQLDCFISKPTSFIFTTFDILYILLLLPLSIFILYHGLQQWWKKRCASSAATMNHADCFTYHMVTLELLRIFGYVLNCCGIYVKDVNILVFAGSLGFIAWCGEIFFHILTCVERYLAVVHPITYLGLKQERGIRMRNITTGCVWLLCSVMLGLWLVWNAIFMINFCVLIVSLIIISFCSLTVLCVLIRPDPRERGGNRGRFGQSKQRAFYTIVVILGVLVLKFVGNISQAAVYHFEGRVSCAMMAFAAWGNLPGSLVLPLLYLHREGKLLRCRKNIQ